MHCADERAVFEEQRQPRGRRKDVVGGLAHVDVIVRVHHGVGAARAAEKLGRAVGEHLVGVHVVRRARAGLVHVDDELIAQLAGKDFVCRGDDGIGNARVEASERPCWPRPPRA